MTTAPTPQQLSTAMSLIDRRYWAPTHFAVLEHIRSRTIDLPTEQMAWGGSRLVLAGQDVTYKGSYRTIAAKTGLSESVVWRSLKALQKAKALLNHDQGRGNDAALWQINGKFAEWQAPWRRPRSEVLAELELLIAARYRAATEGSMPRAIGQHWVVVGGSRSPNNPPILAEQWGANGPHCRAIARGNGVFDAARQRAALEPSQNGEPPLPQSSASPPPTLEEEEHAKKKAAAVLDAIHQVSGRDLWGQPRARVVAAIDHLDHVDSLVTELLTAGPQPWQGAVEAALRLAWRGPAGANGGGKPDRHEDLERAARIRALESEVAWLRDLSEKSPTYLADLQACEEELAELRETGNSP